MLLRFSVENWMSFRDETTFSMVATRERQHSDHLAKIKKYGLKILPVAMIYGGNASGKSNFFKALSFAHSFIKDPPKAEAAISVRPFRLRAECAGRPTTFRFDVVIGETVYEYRFSVTAKEVEHEELRKIHAASEELIFRRGTNGEFDLSEKVEEQDRQRSAFQGTRSNQLFLTNSVSQRLQEFKPIFDWFEALIFVAPNTRYRGLPDITSDRHPLLEKMTSRLRDLDSGIHALDQVDISPEACYPKESLDEIAASLSDDETYLKRWERDGTFLRKEGGKMVAKRLSSIHQADNGDKVLFSLADESDGTLRLLDLLPAFLFLERKNFPYVIVIDELDRSLHSLLTTALLEGYLGQRSDASRSQLIFTTHDTQLMNQTIFRRDEIWITERKSSGESSLVAFSEFKDVRNDKDIQKSYLEGRMGGIPKIKGTNALCESEGGE